jgi:hypothetical protein
MSVKPTADSAALAHPRLHHSLPSKGRATIIETNHATLTEGAKAAWWRRNVVKLGPEMLSVMTGYSVQAIYQFERGVTERGRPHKPKALLRYRMACAGCDAAVRGNRTFQWGIK